MTNKNNYSALPLSQLEKLGINEDMLAKMPDIVREPLLKGRMTPVVEARINVGNDTEILMPVRLHVVPAQNGASTLMLYPVQREIRNKFGMNERELNALKEGRVLSKMVNENGVVREMLFQLDPQTRSIFFADTKSLNLDETLSDLEKIHDISLGTEQRQRIREGKPVELSMGADNKPVTVGVDLREPQGIRFLENDFQEWSRQQKIDYDLAHPEIKGFVMTEQNEWEYAQVIRAKSGHDETAKQDLSRKSGFHL